MSVPLVRRADATQNSTSRAKALIALVTSILVAIVLLVCLIASQYRQVIDGWKQRQSSIADERLLLVTNWLQERTSDAEGNAQSPEVIQYLSQTGSGVQIRKRQDGQLLSHLTVLKVTEDSYSYRGVYVLDREGQVLTQAPDSISPPLLLGKLGRSAVQSGRLQIGWFQAGPSQGVLCIVSPVPGRGDPLTPGQSIAVRPGAVALVVDPHKTLFPLLTSETVPTQTGEILLVARSGKKIAYLSPLRDGTDAMRVVEDRATLAAHAALERRPMFGAFEDYRGAPVLAATRNIPSMGWGLVSKIDRSEALADLCREAWFEIGTVTLLWLAIAGWFFGYRRHARMKFLKMREEEFRDLLDSTPDGLVILDASSSIQLVNSTTEGLFGYRREELVGRSFSVLVPVESPPWLDRPGKTVAPGFDIPIRGRRKDGSEFPAELSIGQVRSSEGRLFCAAIRDLTERKRIEAELKRTEGEYSLLFNASNDATFVLELGEDGIPGTIIQANDAACQSLGYSGDELLQRSIRDLSKPGTFDPLAGVREHLAETEHCVFETEHLTREGRLIPVEVSARAIQFRGRPAVLAVARDIAERRKAEAAVLASERRYRRYVERNAAAFLRCSLDGEILDCNDALVRILGYSSKEELQTHRITEVYVDPLDRIQLIGLLKERPFVNDCELQWKRKDGSTIWSLVNLTLVMDDDCEPVLEGSAIDITERKRIEKELRTLASIVEASTDFIGFASIEGRVLFINAAGREMVGLKADAAVSGTSIFDYVVEEDREHARDLPDLFQEGHWAGEVHFKNFTTGAAIPMWQSTFIISDPLTNQRIAMATICRDLTSRKLEESELRAAKQAAEAGNRAKSRFLANMSHEIRTPMNGILGMARLLLTTELSAVQRHYAEVALASGETLLALVNDILDLSKIEAGRVALEKLDFELDAIMDGALQGPVLEARRKGLGLTRAIDPSVPRFLRGDPTRLRQIIANLATNAVKFTSQGSVHLSVKVAADDERRPTLRFGVTDTGIGIPAEQAKNLFSPFVQADESTTRKFGGTGLGLAISKQLVELMGGQIGVDSQPGKGSCFWFTAPFEKRPAPIVTGDPQESGALVPAKSDRGERRHARILLAEDHPVNRDVMLAVLEHLGYQADPVSNGREAVEALTSRDYDLVLMDCQMPEMDGFEATRLIRQPNTGARDPRVAIIAVTASAMAGDSEKCFQAGMDDYISKPVEPENLARVIDKWLGRTRDVATMPLFSVPADPPVERVVFDRAGLLKRLMGNKSLAERVAGAFLENAALQLLNLRSHIAAHDAGSARRDAHTLKGAAATVSAPALRELALQAEKAAAAGEWSSIEALVPQLEDELERFRADILNEVPA